MVLFNPVLASSKSCVETHKLALEMGLGFRVWGEDGGPEMHMTTPIPLSFISLAKPAFGCAQSFDTGFVVGEKVLGFCQDWF